ncbi:hypothetical protein [Paractinoplanes atraurantiacus]|nr:hypothetical protein [Actinoplanes atraurantiacus]
MNEVEVFDRLSSVQRPMVTSRRLRHAVVLGGSIAGLLAARVLADHAEEVVVVEGRTGGVPQATQIHTLLPGGQAQIERWFPGFTEQAVAAGAVLSQPHEVERWANDVRAVDTPNSVLLTQSRDLLEAVLRRRTFATGNVRSVAASATGLTYENGRVTGVLAGRTLPADFVVDAMGRGSGLAGWLERDGWESPKLERKRIDVNYATARFARAGSTTTGVAVARYSPGYPKRTQAAASAIEDGQWMLMLATYGAERPPRDLDGFLARCADLPPVFGRIAAEEPIGDIKPYGMPDARRLRYDRLRRHPAGLVSVGDAVASFDPIYGQGMTSAALHASCLSEYLCGPATSTGTFFDLQKVIVDATWEFPVPPEIARAAVVDEWVGTRFNDVTFMLAHPATLAALEAAGQLQ